MTRIDWLAALRALVVLGRFGWRGLGGFRGGRIDRRGAERALEIVEQVLARPQRPFEHLRRERSDRVCRRRGRGRRREPLDHSLQIGNQVLVGTLGFALLAFEQFQNLLDAVDGGENERDGFAGRLLAVAKLAHQRLGGMRERFQPRQTEEAAGALDGVHQAEDVTEDLGVVGILLETHELDVDDVETLVRLGHEFPQQVVHEKRLTSTGSGPSVALRQERGQCVGEAFNFSCGIAERSRDLTSSLTAATNASLRAYRNRVAFHDHGDFDA